MRKYYIYGIFRKSEPDNIIYVGQHTYININDSYMGSGKLITELYKTEGRDNFSKVILEYDISQENIGYKEKFYIQKFRDLKQAELNIANGSGPNIKITLKENQTLKDYYKEKSHEYYEINKEKINNKYLKNREHRLLSFKKYYLENNKEILDKKHEYYEKNKERIKNRNNLNKEKIKEKDRLKYISYSKEKLNDMNKRRKILRKIKKCPLLNYIYINFSSVKEKTLFINDCVNIIDKNK